MHRRRKGTIFGTMPYFILLVSVICAAGATIALAAQFGLLGALAPVALLLSLGLMVWRR